MKLNLGCADRYVDGWINVDHAGSPHRQDVTVDLSGPLPWTEYSVTSVYAGHLLEHLDMEHGAASLLWRLQPCMVEGGVIMVVGPDVDRARQMIADGTFDSTHHTLDSIIHGDHRWPGTEHRWECTGPAVVDLLRRTGWTEVTEIGIENVSNYWPVIDRSQRWQCAVTATRRTFVEPV